jgi:sulfur-carrier protein
MRVLFFAQLKDAAGCDAAEIAVPVPLNSGQLWTTLLRRFPGLAPHRETVRFARNREYATAEMTFAEADEIALIPPVSGG